MYDLAIDPREMDNVYQKPAYAKRAAEIKERLIALRRKVGDTDEDCPEALEAIRKHWND